MRHRERLRWAAVAVAAAVGLVVTALVSTRTDVGRSLDHVVRDWVLSGLPGSLRLALSDLARPLVIVVLGPLVVGLALLALVRRAWRRAAAGVVVPMAATVLALQMRLGDVFGTGDDAFPSTHAAAGLGLLVGVALVWPRRVTRRGLLVLVVAGFCVGVGNVSWYAHQPRDVAGSALLVASLTALVLAVLGGDSPNLAQGVGTSGAQRHSSSRAQAGQGQAATDRQTRA